MLMKIDIGYRYYLAEVPVDAVGPIMSILGTAKEADYEFVVSGKDRWYFKKDGAGINVSIFNGSLQTEEEIHEFRREKELEDLKKENARLKEQLEEAPNNTMGIAA